MKPCRNASWKQVLHLLFLTLPALPQWALACMCPEIPLREQIESSELIFKGEVISVDHNIGAATFAVHKVYKGDSSLKTLTYLLPSRRSKGASTVGTRTSCDFRFEFSVGDTTVFFARDISTRKGQTIFAIDSCKMSSYFQNQKQFQELLDARD